MIALILALEAEPEAGSPEAAQLLALTQFYKLTGGPYTWKKRAFWLSKDVHFCRWYGVACDAQNNVIALSLPDNGLTNRIPEQLAELTELRELDLSRNVFLTKIVPQLCALKKLTRLALRQNNINFELPSCVCTMNILDLDIAQNNISGYLPGCSWTVQALSAECNNIHKDIPWQYDGMAQLDVRCNPELSGCDEHQKTARGALLCGNEHCVESGAAKSGADLACLNADPRVQCPLVYTESLCGDFVVESYLGEYLEKRKQAAGK